MTIELKPLPGAIPELLAQTVHTGSITRADQYGLMAALLQDSISDEDRQLIDRILYFTRRGKLKIVNELSFVEAQ